MRLSDAPRSGFILALRYLGRPFSHGGREQLNSLDPLLGPTYLVRARHRFHVIAPMSVRPRRGQ